MRIHGKPPTDFLPADIGKVRNVSRERVRQIEVEALDRLRVLAERRNLKCRWSE